MLFFLILSCLSFIIFYNSLQLKHFRHWASEMRFVSLFFWKDSSLLDITRFIKTSLLSSLYSAPFRMSFRNKSLGLKVVNRSDREGDDRYHCLHSDTVSSNIPNMDLLDLPDTVLECILERLPPEALRSMAIVCCSMHERCMSHMKQKWEKVIGPAAYRKWQLDIAYEKESSFSNKAKEKGLINLLAKLWPVSLVRSSCNNNGSNCMMVKNYNPIDSVMSLYLNLESGNFWFPAQVYNRENGDFGFTLSCYDAELCYDHKTDTFQARYPPHGRKATTIETGMTWDRVRSIPIDTSPYDIYNSNCLTELRPGDHIEIQWRRNNRFPYGWWYGIVDHLEQCNHNYCRCPESDVIVVDFNHYAFSTRWRKTIISKKDHKEEGNAAGGFYAGVRKLEGRGEISKWNKLRPAAVWE